LAPRLAPPRDHLRLEDRHEIVEAARDAQVVDRADQQRTDGETRRHEVRARVAQAPGGPDVSPAERVARAAIEGGRIAPPAAIGRELALDRVDRRIEDRAAGSERQVKDAVLAVAAAIPGLVVGVRGRRDETQHDDGDPHDRRAYRLLALAASPARREIQREAVRFLISIARSISFTSSWRSALSPAAAFARSRIDASDQCSAS
jgi:hypothetical protein